MYRFNVHLMLCVRTSAATAKAIWPLSKAGKPWGNPNFESKRWCINFGDTGSLTVRPWKGTFPKGKVVFQPIIFQGLCQTSGVYILDLPPQARLPINHQDYCHWGWDPGTKLSFLHYYWGRGNPGIQLRTRKIKGWKLEPEFSFQVRFVWGEVV